MEMRTAGGDGRISRRRALALGGGVAGGILAAGMPGGAQALAGARAQGAHAAASGSLPVAAIERIVQAKGSVSGGVLDIGLDRDDIGDVKGPLGVTFTPSFQINGNLFFQPLAHGRALLNGDLALKPDELQAFIDALLDHGLVFQAFHQHFPDLDPMVWFMHFRGVGDPLALARAAHAAVRTTSTPLPQAPPPHPTTPLDPKRLGSILHGDTQVGSEGVVTVSVLRKNHFTLGGVPARSETNLLTTIDFKPLGGSRAAVVPDFAMTAHETQAVMRTMRARGWFVGCLYNQETDEHPQLYFSHQLKTGDAYQLAHEIRLGLNHTNSE
jgi:Domain of Unknown Function (DUF1259)